MSVPLKPETVNTLIFDLGNVLVDIDWSESIKLICGLLQCRPDDEIFRDLEHSEASRQFHLGTKTPEQFYYDSFGADSEKISYRQFAGAWNHTFSLIEPMIGLVRELDRFKRLMLSNTNLLHAEYIRDTYGFFGLFDHLILSHEVHLLKPVKEIYLLAAERAEAHPENCLLIDDKLENVNGAANAGMQALHFTGYEMLAAKFHEWGWLE